MNSPQIDEAALRVVASAITEIVESDVNMTAEHLARSLITAYLSAVKAAKSEFVQVKFDEITGYGEFHLEWLSNNQVSIAINDRRFVLSSNAEVKLNHDFPHKPSTLEE